ncbi:endonuclease/exonuclease/phosphatase family protein (macronuclear) [Tetrahymena thermophila SB210]|uniref:phosphoinositide 5-phosphatase n=1 Tax=Tetrahymena thermophila (strain SB210) TaxID=312017 RepID=I7MLB2_TETTS|nr:endonuclease/exonuclease/phosphatase family protein [Tetrahymena thermophila SB210]EAS01600.2 endonuclease/exonuclease/phosphatase family protein [Tetrahymena thermophila SB210]|eukprot:XP_001021845.2 endonuclease/exonuclease/phosphatase family protein [Tetrahymena thermophila SB210]
MDKHSNFQESQELRKPLNINAVTVEQYKNCFIIKADPLITGIDSSLQIDIDTGRIQEIKKDQKLPQMGEAPKEKKGCAFLGLLHIKFHPFLVFAGEVKPICTIENNQVYEIHSIFFKAFHRLDYNETSTGRKVLNLQNHLKKLFSSGFYFSYQFDLTLSKQKKSKGNSKESSFAWNTHLMKDLFQQNISQSWQLSLIYGYVGYFYTVVNKKRLDYYLISRKSRHQAGTSVNVRGLDDEGNAANFVETEVIIYYNKFCCSSVYVRGSVPVFWSQESSVRLSQYDDITHNAFIKHFDLLREQYGKVMCLNLMSKSKTNEQILTEAFENHFEKANFKNQKYQYFDYNGTIKNNKNDLFNDLLNKNLNAVIQNFQFYAEDGKNWEIIQDQIGVFRINCFDCLNRSNQAMLKISLKILQQQMKCLNISIPNFNTKSDSDVLTNFDTQVLNMSNNKQKVNQFIYNLQELWDQNANSLSRAYIGTDANTSNQKQGFFALVEQGVKGINKLYQQNFEDSAKQGSIDLILGQTIFQDLFNEKILKVLKKREQDFTTLSNLNVFCMTWNMNGNEPDAEMNFAQNIFNFEKQPNPDIVVIGLQEMVKLNVQNVMMTNNERIIQTWLDYLNKQLNSISSEDKYKMLKWKDLVGIFMVLFVKEPLVKRIKRLESEEVKTGLGGKLGNKGCVIIKFTVDDSNICLINSHLESGLKNSMDRIKNIQEIHQKLLSSDQKRKDGKNDFDYRIFMGDMNFRVQLPNSETRIQLDRYENSKKHSKQDAQTILRELLKQDQLNILRDKSEKHDYLSKYQEHQINFPPTYKFDVGTRRYDTSKKNRTPSWCDRILIWHNENLLIKQYFYNSKELLHSDHRPVVTYYNLEIKKIDQEKRAQIIKTVYNQSEDDIEEIEKIMDVYNLTTGVNTQTLGSKKLIPVEEYNTMAKANGNQEDNDKMFQFYQTSANFQHNFNQQQQQQFGQFSVSQNQNAKEIQNNAQNTNQFQYSDLHNNKGIQTIKNDLIFFEPDQSSQIINSQNIQNIEFSADFNNEKYVNNQYQQQQQQQQYNNQQYNNQQYQKPQTQIKNLLD